jgi:beta-barrel assembly-enhancing protease
VRAVEVFRDKSLRMWELGEAAPLFTADKMWRSPARWTIRGTFNAVAPALRRDPAAISPGGCRCGQPPDACAYAIIRPVSELTRTLAHGLMAVIGVLSATTVVGQTRITAPANKYTPAQDVELGREAAQQARQELPLMRDDAVSAYVSDLGRRLETGISPEWRRAEFVYSFDTVNVRDINAFALPGGPMFVNRGMIEAAASEGEVAGVMAHEISHVVLRHGTAQASKVGRYQAGAVAGAIFGAIVGGRLGDVIAQGTQFGLGTYFLKFGREYERQADLLGAQIMARSGYDPRDMASMFRTIEKESGAGGPEWMSSHPNPGNRSEYITKEAQALRVERPADDSRRFERVKEHLKALPKAPSSEEAARARTTSGGRSNAPATPPSGNVPPPASRYTQYTAGNIFRVSVPSNWRQIQGSTAVTYAPEGAYGSAEGRRVFTHGVEFGLSGEARRDLRGATNALIDSLRQANPRMRTGSGLAQSELGGQPALVTTLDNISDVTGAREIVEVTTTRLGDGRLFYAIAVAPESDVSAYSATFERVLSTLRFLR